MSFTMQIKTINYIQKVLRCLIFSPIPLFIGICRSVGAGGPGCGEPAAGSPAAVCGSLPIASFPVPLFILISCFCTRPVESGAESSPGAAGVGMSPSQCQAAVPGLHPASPHPRAWFCWYLTVVHWF